MKIIYLNLVNLRKLANTKDIKYTYVYDKIDIKIHSKIFN
jgi:hypothetical protein